ncbi:MAG: hypothetical protein MR691_14880 [Clostridium sp.]|nr:hypothetical protein [Clostridium sp.]
MEYNLIDKGEKIDFFDGSEWHTIYKKMLVGYAIRFNAYTKALGSLLGFHIEETIEELEDIMKEYEKSYFES